jgi:lauroyl/myristoyl acyltransferase
MLGSWLAGVMGELFITLILLLALLLLPLSLLRLLCNHIGRLLKS